MENSKVKITTIHYRGKKYDIFWEINTKLVWLGDDSGKLKNQGEAKAYTEDKVLECAMKMLELSGL